MYKENNIHLLIRAINHLEKQEIINSAEWKNKRSFLKRENAVNCGKKRQDLATVGEIVYRCCRFEGVKPLLIN